MRAAGRFVFGVVVVLLITVSTAGAQYHHDGEPCDSNWGSGFKKYGTLKILIVRHFHPSHRSDRDEKASSDLVAEALIIGSMSKAAHDEKGKVNFDMGTEDDHNIVIYLDIYDNDKIYADAHGWDGHLFYMSDSTSKDDWILTFPKRLAHFFEYGWTCN
jgi:hypothetical protein